jgi:hypothetical protein
MTKIIKFTIEKIFGSKITIYISLGLHKGRPSYSYIFGSFLPSWIRIRISKLQKKPSALKREHPALQNMKFLNFFPIFVVHFCPPGSGSRCPSYRRSLQTSKENIQHFKA